NSELSISNGPWIYSTGLGCGPSLLGAHLRSAGEVPYHPWDLVRVSAAADEDLEELERGVKNPRQPGPKLLIAEVVTAIGRVVVEEMTLVIHGFDAQVVVGGPCRMLLDPGHIRPGQRCAVVPPADRVQGGHRARCERIAFGEPRKEHRMRHPLVVGGRTLPHSFEK